VPLGVASRARAVADGTMAAVIDSVTSAVPDPIVPIIRVGLDPQPLAESEP
jgi:hypothetical protein